MTLTELQTAVYGITNRPDLVAKTLDAIQGATLKIHHSDYYWKDIYEAKIDFQTESYEPDFEYRTFIPLWRAGKYFRKYLNNTTPSTFLEYISPENAIDSYVQSRVDVWYPAGEVIHLKSSNAIRYVLMGCYVNPDITESGFNSWVAKDHPYAIIYGAARTIFRIIGKTEESAGMTQEFSDQMILLNRANVVGYGE